MRRFFLILFFITNQINCLAQEIIWAKRFLFGPGFLGSIQISSICQKMDSSFIAGIGADFWGKNIPNFGYVSGTGIVYLNKSGDTTKFVNLNTYGWRQPKVALGLFHEIFFATAVSYDTTFNSKIRVFKLDSSGNTIWARFLSGPNYNRAQVTKLLPTPDGGCIVLGHVAGVQFWSDWLVMKYSYSGDLEWSQRFNGGGTSEANNIEPMPGGNYLVSGMVNNRIWSLVIDANGQQLSNSAYFFHNSPNNFLLQGAQAIQIPQKEFLATGAQYFNDIWNTFNGKYDSSKTFLSGGYQNIAILKPWVNNDGGFSRVESQLGDSTFLRKYEPDSSRLWSVTLGKNPNVLFYDVAYDNLGSAVLAGFIKDSQNRDNAYIVKVANMGLPFDPTQNKAIYETPAFRDLAAFPNPVRDRLHFKNVFFPSSIQVFDLLGRKKGEFSIKPGEAIDLSHLPKGQYMVRVEAEGKARAVRVMKE
jgi:hypothetical protein